MTTGNHKTSNESQIKQASAENYERSFWHLVREYEGRIPEYSTSFLEDKTILPAFYNSIFFIAVQYDAPYSTTT